MPKVLAKQDPKTKMIEEIENEIQKSEKEMRELKVERKDLEIKAQIARKLAQKLGINPLESKMQEEMKERAAFEAELSEHSVRQKEQEISNLEFELNYLKTKLNIFKDPTF